MLPVGVKDEPRLDTAKVFCPRCQQIYKAQIQTGTERALSFRVFWVLLWFVPSPSRLLLVA